MRGSGSSTANLPASSPSTVLLQARPPNAPPAAADVVHDGNEPEGHGNRLHAGGASSSRRRGDGNG
eukprot:364971-Chlamydomonas_euryale.AAC.19